MKGRTVSQTRSLAIAGVENFSGFDIDADPTIETLRSGRFRKDKLSVTGAGPKDFIRVYEHGSTNRTNPSRWPAYIAKVGHKWYPNESITEHFLTRLGQGLGLRIADSRLMWVRGQLRFLSRIHAKHFAFSCAATEARLGES